LTLKLNSRYRLKVLTTTDHPDEKVDIFYDEVETVFFERES